MPSGTGRNALWPSIEHRERNTAAVIVGGKVFRAIDSRSWDAGRRLQDMQLDDVDVQVVSPMPELLSHWFPVGDADALSSHINCSIAKLRILLRHGGGDVPGILPRRKCARARGPPLQDLFARDPDEMARTFYYATILYDRLALRFLADSVGADHIVIGSDYPFSIKQDRPAQFAEQALGISRETFAANTARFLNQAPSTIWSAVTVEQQQENQGETGG